MLRALIALSSSRNRRHHHYRRDLPSSLVRPPPPFLPNRPTEIATSSNRRAQLLSRNLSARRRSSPRLHRAAENRDLRVENKPPLSSTIRTFKLRFGSRNRNYPLRLI